MEKNDKQIKNNKQQARKILAVNMAGKRLIFLIYKCYTINKHG